MFEVISLFAVGFAVAGIVLAGFKLFRRKPPRYLIPLTAGVTMIAFTLWNDYTWAERTISLLPDDVQVVKTVPKETLWQPWTLVAAPATRLVALDTTKTRRNSNLPGYVLAESILMQRHDQTMTALHLFDCRNDRRADLARDTEFGEDGLPKDTQWLELSPNDPLLRAACAQP